MIDLANGEKMPEEIVAALMDDRVTKWAWNASFERIWLSAWMRKNRQDNFCGYDEDGMFLNPEGWRCTMILAAYNGLPLSLEKAGAALGLEEQKMKEGKELIRFFCTPKKERAWRKDGDTEGQMSFLTDVLPCPGNRKTDTAAVGLRWNMPADVPVELNKPADAPEKWELFKAYNARDVEVEMQIQARLSKFPVLESVWTEYRQDQEINDRGIRIDQKMVRQAIRIDETAREALTTEMRERTGLENPGSVAQLKGYLENHGIAAGSIGKKDVAEMIQTAPEDVREVLELRLQAAKSSVKKYTAMENAVCADGRCRGLFQFYGANRTGRWAGRLVQLQNLAQNHMKDLAEARALVKAGDENMLNLLYGGKPGIPTVLSELIRTALIPREGYKFIVSDFSAIEARVLSCLAGEDWRMEVFRTGGDIYCQSASAMFKVTVEKHGVNSELRQKGKMAELACGYGGGVGALIAMGGREMGLEEAEMKRLVELWRESNPNIVEYW